MTRIPAARWATGLLLGGLLASASVQASPVASASPLGDARSRAAALRAQVDDLRTKAEIATEQYDETYAQLGQAVNAHIDAQRQLDAAKAASGASSDQKSLRARALYMSGGPTAIYATVLTSGSLTDVATRVHQVQVVMVGDAREVHDANTAVQRLAGAEQALATSERLANSLQKKVATQADRVNALLARTQGLLDAADKDVRDLAEQQRQAAAAAA
ncbi:MAG: hypothetical protein JWO22_3376, partial [Frankiales bacterium]|nr:hypothetical protein [Frankiales bacterium]